MVEKYIDLSQINFTQSRIEHWNKVAQKTDHWNSVGKGYQKRINNVFQFLIPENSRVLEIGCARGGLLASVKPSYGVGIDFSSEMISRAKQAYPELNFYEMDALEMEIDGKFDYIILSDVVNDLWDFQAVLESIKPNLTSRTRLIINFYSRLWEGGLKLAQTLNLSTPLLTQNWFTHDDVENLLELTGFDVLKHQREVLFPFGPRFFSDIFNRFLVKIWPFNQFALTNVVVARPQPKTFISKPPKVSVIVPARNEAGNIKNIIDRIPEMGGGTEIVFVEGHSQDETYQEIKNQLELNTELNSQLWQQKGIGKGDAVRLGFDKATGDILMILDADLTVPPEDLPRFYDALVNGKGDLINGVRLVYPLEEKAMRFLNFLGNKFFSLAFSWLLDQPIKDTLCGTKVMYKEDYLRIADHRPYFGEFDPFGDFDLLFNAAKLGMKIVDIPIRYRERVYGDTNIDRWRHGWLLIKMAVIAARKLKFL